MPSKSSVIGTHSDISNAAFVGAEIVALAEIMAFMVVPAHAGLLINSGVFLHQPKNDMVQLLVSVSQFTLDLLESAFHALQCSYVFR